MTLEDSRLRRWFHIDETTGRIVTEPSEAVRNGKFRIYDCGICSRFFHTGTELDAHRRALDHYTTPRPDTSRIVVDEPPEPDRNGNFVIYACGICTRFFYTRAELDEHRRALDHFTTSKLNTSDSDSCSNQNEQPDVTSDARNSKETATSGRRPTEEDLTFRHEVIKTYGRQRTAKISVTSNFKEIYESCSTAATSDAARCCGNKSRVISKTKHRNGVVTCASIPRTTNKIMTQEPIEINNGMQQTRRLKSGYKDLSKKISTTATSDACSSAGNRLTQKHDAIKLTERKRTGAGGLKPDYTNVIKNRSTTATSNPFSTTTKSLTNKRSAVKKTARKRTSGLKTPRINVTSTKAKSDDLNSPGTSTTKKPRAIKITRKAPNSFQPSYNNAVSKDNPTDVTSSETRCCRYSGRIRPGVHRKRILNTTIDKETQSRRSSNKSGKLAGVRKKRGKLHGVSKGNKRKTVHCVPCNMKLRSESAFALHQKTYHFPKKSLCQICFKVMKTKFHLWKHEDVHRILIWNTERSKNPRTGIQCPHCPKNFMVKSSARNHVRVSHPQHVKLQCRSCREILVTQAEADEHELDCHVVPVVCLQ